MKGHDVAAAAAAAAAVAAAAEVYAHACLDRYRHPDLSSKSTAHLQLVD